MTIKIETKLVMQTSSKDESSISKQFSNSSKPNIISSRRGKNTYGAEKEEPAQDLDGDGVVGQIRRVILRAEEDELRRLLVAHVHELHECAARQFDSVCCRERQREQGRSPNKIVAPSPGGEAADRHA